MGEAFQRLKKRYFLRAILISGIVGFLCALALVGVFLLAFKLSGVAFFWAWYLLIAVGACGLCFGILYSILRPVDLKLAKKLDKEYGLGQKIQTMVECVNREGDLYEVQREDALEKLSQVKPKKRSPWTFVNYAVAGLLAFSLFFTGVFLPANAYVDPSDNFEISDWQERSLLQLIKEVQDSSMKDTLKSAEVTSLEGLLSVLRGEHTATAMKAAVSAAMSLSVQLAAEENSYDELANAFTGDLQKFGESVSKSAESYGAKRDITSMEYVEGRREYISDAISEIMKSAPEDLNAAVMETNNLTGASTIKAYSDEIKTALSSVTEWDEEDALFKSFSVYFQALDNAATAEGHPLTLRQENVILAGETFAGSASLALSDQVYAEMTCEYVRRKLGSIFSVAITDSTETPTLPDGDEEGGSNGGGGGNAEIEFGSNDIIYDTRNGEYTEYGKVINEYYAAVREILQNNDTLTEEMKEKIEDYFNVLYRGYGD